MPKTKVVDLNSEDVNETEIVGGAAPDNLPAVAQSATPSIFHGDVGGVEGETDFSDYKLPRLQIVQGVGPLSQKFRNKGGSIVFAGEEIISDGTTPVELTVLRAVKSYEEKVDDKEYGTRMPGRAQTQAEVIFNGGTLLKTPDGKGGFIPPTWRPVLTCLVAVKGDPQSPHFPYVFEDGSAYGLAVWKIVGWSYSTAAKSILTASKFAYRESLVTGSFELTTKFDSYGAASAYVAHLGYGKRHDAKLKTWLKEFAASAV
jgi:hypothetical protein